MMDFRYVYSIYYRDTEIQYLDSRATSVDYYYRDFDYNNVNTESRDKCLNVRAWLSPHYRLETSKVNHFSSLFYGPFC
jgi:hypothetical protein